MLHDKPCIQLCLFVWLVVIVHALLSFAHRLFSQAGSEIKCDHFWGSTLYHIINDVMLQTTMVIMHLSK